MSDMSSTGTSKRGTIAGSAQLRLAGLLVLLVVAVAVALYVTVSKPATPAAANNATEAAVIQNQTVQAGQAQQSAARPPKN